MNSIVTRHREVGKHMGLSPWSLKEGAQAIVAAHPDDEALWLSGALEDASRVVFCFGDIADRVDASDRRRRAIASLEFKDLRALLIPESGVKHAVDWRRASLTPEGVEIADHQVRLRYQKNSFLLREKLQPLLADCGVVYTHNPWGEYGHAEHVQVNRVVMELQEELGYVVVFTNYVGQDSWSLVSRFRNRFYWHDKRRIRPNVEYARALMRVYERFGVWTWNRYHRWPKWETTYAVFPNSAGRIRRWLAGERLADVRGLRYWPPPIPIHRRRA